MIRPCLKLIRQKDVPPDYRLVNGQTIEEAAFCYVSDNFLKRRRRYNQQTRRAMGSEYKVENTERPS